MKNVLSLSLLLLTFAYNSSIHARVVSQISIDNENVFHNETILLNNDKDLVINGLLLQTFNEDGNVLKVTLNYIGDENGYRARVEYKLEGQEALGAAALNPSSLKSLSG